MEIFGGAQWGGGRAKWREWPAAVPRLSGRRAGRGHSEGPLAPAPGGAISLLSRSTTRLQLAAAELAGEGVVKRRLSGSWIWARQSREVCALRAGDEAAPGVAGSPRR